MQIFKGPMKHIGLGVALNMEATADALESQHKMDFRLKKTEVWSTLFENECMGSQQFKNGNSQTLTQLCQEIVIVFLQTFKLNSFLLTERRKFATGHSLLTLSIGILIGPQRLLRRCFLRTTWLSTSGPLTCKQNIVAGLSQQCAFIKKYISSLTKSSGMDGRPSADVPSVPRVAREFIKSVMRATATAAKVESWLHFLTQSVGYVKEM